MKRHKRQLRNCLKTKDGNKNARGLALNKHTQHVVSSLIMNSDSQNLFSEFEALGNRYETAQVTPQTPPLLHGPATSCHREHPARGSPPTPSAHKPRNSALRVAPRRTRLLQRRPGIRPKPTGPRQPPGAPNKGGGEPRAKAARPPPSSFAAARRPLPPCCPPRAPRHGALRVLGEGPARPHAAGREGGEGWPAPVAPGLR